MDDTAVDFIDNRVAVVGYAERQVLQFNEILLSGQINSDCVERKLLLVFMMVVFE